MKASTALRRAEILREKINELLSPVNAQLAKLFGDNSASILYQESDGWVVLFNEDHNALISPEALDEVLKMNREDATKFLMRSSL